MFARKENIEIEFRDVPYNGHELSRYHAINHANGDVSCKLTGTTHRDAAWEVYVLIHDGWTVTMR